MTGKDLAQQLYQDAVDRWRRGECLYEVVEEAREYKEAYEATE